MTPELIDALAIYRVTRLATKDSIFDRPRDAVQDWLDDHDHRKLSELSGCPWCLGMYVAAGAAVLRWRAPRFWDVVRWPLAMSAAAGVIAEWDSRA